MSATVGQQVVGLGRPDKIQARHLDRLAVVYIRQSTVQQVLRHQESTKLQYSLTEVADRFGWPRERILVIDEDLGLSGASSEGRAGFQRLLSEVALDHVGLILGVEMSRLARSCKDWHQLLELCAIFGTLISDLDGLYDPAHYNDRLLLGLKGTMSEAELHIIKQRMSQGRAQKARRGELGMLVPFGYVRRPSGEVALDPDQEVQATVRLVFEQFARLGTVDGVLCLLMKRGVRFGIRVLSGTNKGELEWRRPNRTMVSRILKHPAYAGAYVYGRSATDPRRKTPGRRHTGRVLQPDAKWQVCLRNRLPAYVSWEEYERNKAQLEANRSYATAPGVPRKGFGLLQGLVTCGRCGLRMQVCPGRRGFNRYACPGERVTHGGPTCQALSTKTLDAEVSRLALAALEPASLEVSLRVSEDLEQQRNQLEAQWTLRLERARYEAERAARQFNVVEPENRLVARTLEQVWEEKLKTQRGLEEEHARSIKALPRALTTQERELIQSLASDIPALWHSSTTSNTEKKTILRQILDRVVVRIEGETEWVEAEIHWAGGHRTYTRLRRSVARLPQLSNYEELLEKVRALKAEGLTSRQIADRLNGEGCRPPRLKTFGAHTVRALLSRHGLTRVHRFRPKDRSILAPHEYWLPDLAKELAMPDVTLQSWVKRGWAQGRQINGPQGFWVILADDAEKKRLLALRTRTRKKDREQHPAPASAHP